MREDPRSANAKAAGDRDAIDVLMAIEGVRPAWMNHCLIGGPPLLCAGSRASSHCMFTYQTAQLAAAACTVAGCWHHASPR